MFIHLFICFKRFEFGVIYTFAFPLEGGDGELEVATTRPETMFGDVALAIHPSDDRYMVIMKGAMRV